MSAFQVKKAIAVLGLPANPLDSLIDQLGGPDHVAEMTGRKARLVRQQGEGLTGVKWEARNASGVAASATLDLINVHERQMFLNLEKRIAIISEAASAGISLHADRSVFFACQTTSKHSPSSGKAALCLWFAVDLDLLLQSMVLLCCDNNQVRCDSQTLGDGRALQALPLMGKANLTARAAMPVTI